MTVVLLIAAALLAALAIALACAFLRRQGTADLSYSNSVVLHMSPSAPVDARAVARELAWQTRAQLR